MKHVILLLAALLFSVLSSARGEPAYPDSSVVLGETYIVSGAQGVARLERDSGRPVWWVLRQERLHEPVVGEGVVASGGASGVYAIDAVSGDLRWHRDFGSPAFTPVLHQRTFYSVTQDGWLRALAPEDGSERWRTRPGEGWLYPPAVAGKLLITGGQDGVVWGIDAGSGKQQWRRAVDQELVYAPLAVGTDQVVVTTFNGDVISLDSRDGRERWRTRFSTPSLNGTAFANIILLGSMDGSLRAIERDHGRLLWRHALAGRLVMPVRVAGDLVLAVTEAGEYSFLRLSTGEQVVAGRLDGDPVGGVFRGADAAIVFLDGRNKSSVVPVLVSAIGKNNSDQ